MSSSALRDGGIMNLLHGMHDSDGSAKFSIRRKPEFRTISVIIGYGDKKLFIKYPQNELSRQFTENILKREIIAKKGFGNHAVVVQGRKVDGILIYSYIPYPSLEDVISNKLQERDFQGAYHLLKSYVSFLRNLAKLRAIPFDFATELGFSKKSLNKEMDCLSFGPIDCIPANILIGESFWYIVDHEWTYNFPVPVDYVIFRGIYSLTLNLQKVIQSCASPEFPISLVQGYGENQTFIPYKWLSFFGEMEVGLKSLYIWEYSFQKKIQLHSKLGRLRLSRRPEKICNIPRPSTLVNIGLRFIGKLREWISKRS